jgi:acyl-CoA reductase-like NAD-dependent aldehyde dehydrogenase
MRELGCLVGKEWIRPQGPVFEVQNPATNGQVIATLPALGKADVECAIKTAAEAFPAWAARTPAARAEILHKAADLLACRAERVARDLVAENGKPLREARGEIAKSVTTFRYYAGLAGALDGRTFAGGRQRLRHETRLEPIGPVVAITPWNVPAAAPARKLAPALLAGNTVLLKPASATPLSAIHQVECLVEAGVEPGAVQLLCGRGSVVGQGLATHPSVAAVSLTGSSEVGLQLKGALSNSLTRLQLELGGKNAAVVFPDADLSAAVGYIVEAAFASAGQQCTATSRVLVDRKVYETLLQLLAQRVDRLSVGDPLDETTQMGPLIDERQVEVVEGFVKRAVKAGARVVTGGKRVPRPGCFFAPTVLAGVHPTMEVCCEEIFGPVLTVLEFSSVEEAVSLLNGTKYGLSCAVHTQKIGLAETLAERADCGVVVINGPTAGIELPAPFGGFRLSGTESKEHGPESMRFYTRTKLVSWGWS